MKRIILLSLCLIMGAFSLSAQETIYIIDNETVDNFDGSQLIGKSIKDYKISTRGSGRNAITLHSISTSAQPSIFSVSGTFTPHYYGSANLGSLVDSLANSSLFRLYEYKDSIQFPDESKYFPQVYRKTVYVIDGVKHEDESIFATITPSDIESVSVLGDESSKQLGYGDNCTVIMIETKKKGSRK